MNLLADHNLPFAVALVLMALVALAQLLGLGDFGDHDIDHDVDPTAHAGVVDGLLSVFGIGRIPFTMWLALFLFLFAGIGVGIQSLAEGLTGAPLDRMLAAVLAVVPTLPVAGLLARPIAAIMPKDETTAVTLDALVGRRATIVTGRAQAASPARAKVIDHYGHPHFVMTEPQDAGSVIEEGDQILLVGREGERFYCVALQDRRLAPVD